MHKLDLTDRQAQLLQRILISVLEARSIRDSGENIDACFNGLRKSEWEMLQRIWWKSAKLVEHA